MTKQTAEGSGGPDDYERIHDAVVRLRREAITRKEAPVEVLFSPDGFTRAQANNVPGMDPWSARQPWTHYLGYPFRVVREQAEPVALRCVPGGSPEAKAARAESRAQPTPQGVMHGRAKMMLADEATLKALGQAIDLPQLCDLIMIYIKSKGGPATPFQHELADVVREHGRFE